MKTPSDIKERLRTIIHGSDFNVFPGLKAEDFHYWSATFRADPENVPSSVHIPVDKRTAVITMPGPYSKTCDTFRPRAAAQRTAARTGLGSHTFVDDSHRAACRDRLIRQHVAQHRPTGVVNGLRHSRLRQFGRADISDVNFCVVTNDARRRNMQEMLALIGDLRRQRASANLLSTLLEQCVLRLALAIECRRLDSFSVRENSERLQAEVDADRCAFALVRLRQFDLDIHIPAPARIGRELPRLRLAVLRDRPRLPQAIGAAENSKPARVEFRRAFEVRERNEIEVALEASEARRLGEAGVARIGELAADGINRIGMQPQFLGDATAEIGEVKGARALDVPAGFPARGGFAVDLAEIIPDEIHSPRLPSQGVASSGRGVFDAKAVGDNQGVGRLSVVADRRSRTRGSLARSAGSPFVSSRSRKCKAALARPAIPPRPEGRGFSRRIR